MPLRPRCRRAGASRRSRAGPARRPWRRPAGRTTTPNTSPQPTSRTDALATPETADDDEGPQGQGRVPRDGGREALASAQRHPAQRRQAADPERRRRRRGGTGSWSRGRATRTPPSARSAKPAAAPPDATPSQTASGRTPMVHRQATATTAAASAWTRSARPSDVSKASDVTRGNERSVSGRANTSLTVSTNRTMLATDQTAAQREASATAETDRPSTSSLLVGSRNTAASRKPTTTTAASWVRKVVAGKRPADEAARVRDAGRARLRRALTDLERRDHDDEADAEAGEARAERACHAFRPRRSGARIRPMARTATASPSTRCPRCRWANDSRCVGVGLLRPHAPVVVVNVNSPETG